MIVIIGAGRAGNRHRQIAEKMGFDVWVYDPYIYSLQNEDDLKYVLENDNITHGIIAAPPGSHLYYINLLLSYKVRILCEKPLCGLNQLDEAKSIDPASPVMVAYNYRYHPALKHIAGTLTEFRLMTCVQHRELPDWGLLLDHCSHNLDIMRFVSRDEIQITDAIHIEKPDYEQWYIAGEGFAISETVTNYKTDRVATINEVQITADPRMFTDMWSAFLGEDYSPGLSEAIQTQELLQYCYDKEADSVQSSFSVVG
jgi:hypothetical protein